MGLLDGFEKLINEHGSAVILKERIALANDKYAALEQKLVASSLRVSELESENQSLHADLEKAKVEIQNLKALSEKAHGNSLDEIEEKILVALSNHEELDAGQISRLLGIGAQIATFHLDELQQKKMVADYYTVGSPVSWGLIHNGRAYLVRRGLLA